MISFTVPNTSGLNVARVVPEPFCTNRSMRGLVDVGTGGWSLVMGATSVRVSPAVRLIRGVGRSPTKAAQLLRLKSWPSYWACMRMAHVDTAGVDGEVVVLS